MSSPSRSVVVAAETIIEAPASVVWQLLIDLPAYESWYPALRHLDGVVGVGEMVRLRAFPGTDRQRDESVTVVELRPDEVLAWTGGDPEGMHGRHVFTIRPTGDWRCAFRNEEIVTGPGAAEVIEPRRAAIAESLNRFNEALRSVAES